MKIEKVETFAIQKAPIDKKPYWGSRAWGSRESTRQAEVSSEYPSPHRRRYVYSGTIDTVIVKITTDDGLTGWGEAKAPVAPRVAKAIIEDLLAPIVLGQDPRDHLLLWERMYAGMRVRGHRAGFYLEAISGIDIALWDLTGKAASAPVYQMLGGSFRNPVRVYASGIPALPAAAPPEAWEALEGEADSIRERGFTGVKMALGRGLAGDIRSVRAVRERLGSEFMILTDAAGVYDRAQALRLGRELQDLGAGWLEMPTFPEDVEGYVEIAKALDLPIALDSLTSRFEARELIRLGGIDVVQPDVCRAGGVTECRRIAELADNFGIAFAPHVSIGSAIHFAATAHLASAMPNTMISEYWIGDNPLGDRILDSPLRLEGGYLETPSGPGLGISIRESAVLD